MIKRFRFFSVLPLLLVGALAITQESSPGGIEEGTEHFNAELFALEDGPEIPTRLLPGWVHPRRWFRSNKGGMALEEIPSGLTALRGECALLIDFAGAEELPEMLLPFYEDQYYIEVRILYENGNETRRQWIFRDERGFNRLVAVFVEPTDDTAEAEIAITEPAAESAVAQESAENLDARITLSPRLAENETLPPETALLSGEEESAAAVVSLSGFIEVYNKNLMLAREFLFFENGEQRETEYVYAAETLIRAETYQKSRAPGAEEDETLTKLFTDIYRYNRSRSLRFVERLYHDKTEDAVIRLSFPNRLIDAAADTGFISEKLYLGSDFFGSYSTEPGQRMVFNTDDKGRILIQTLVDEEGEEIWVIKNTWSGDRITSSEKIQGEDRRLNEYEYSSGGDLVMERNYLNGILERQIHASDGKELEELFIKGIAVLRAVWEDGRKISEERIRTWEKEQ